MSRLQHELYIEQRSLDQYDAVDFFDFCGFSSDQRQNAVFVWKTITLPQVLQRDSAQHKRLITTWSHSKRGRQKYWNDKQKRDAQLVSMFDAHRITVECVRCVEVNIFVFLSLKINHSLDLEDRVFKK